MDCCKNCCEDETTAHEFASSSKASGSVVGISDIDILDAAGDDRMTEPPEPDESSYTDFSPMGTPRIAQESAPAPPKAPTPPAAASGSEPQAPPSVSESPRPKSSPPAEVPTPPLPPKPADVPKAAVATKPAPVLKSVLPAKQMSELTAEEKEQEKKRLQNVVKSFGKDAVSGISCKAVDVVTGKLLPVTFKMNPQLSEISVSSPDSLPKTAVPLTSFHIADVESTYKSGDVLQKHGDFPLGAEEISEVVGMSIENPAKNIPKSHIFLFFDNRNNMDRFYVSTKILRLSALIARKQKACSSGG
eukprot:GHVQ01018039.1.p3 GENE.GHVQ01018039.1~~GHVQ01018039.1.p3  ORF type:complete len:303 (-),score=34.31 GHVQ01018039.1:2124-3032(-)